MHECTIYTAVPGSTSKYEGKRRNGFFSGSNGFFFGFPHTIIYQVSVPAGARNFFGLKSGGRRPVRRGFSGIGAFAAMLKSRATVAISRSVAICAHLAECSRTPPTRTAAAARHLKSTECVRGDAEYMSRKRLQSAGCAQIAIDREIATSALDFSMAAKAPIPLKPRRTGLLPPLFMAEKFRASVGSDT